jgi:hypothetical protein
MKNFSYIHVEKLKVWGRGALAEKQYKPNKYKRHWGVQGCWEHDIRLISPANADPKRLETNGIACEETQWEILAAKKDTLDRLEASNPHFITQKAQRFLHEKNITPREDQVKVVMLLCAASPEYLRDGSSENPLNKTKVLLWAKTTVGFLKKMYQDRLLACIIHRDELNPHLTAYVVPAIEADIKKRGPKTSPLTPATRKWTLNASKLFTPDPSSLVRLPDGKIRKVHQGKGTCSLLQDLYAQSLQEAGLAIRRGVRRAPHQTGLPHESTQDRWAALSAPLAEVEQIPDNKLREWAKKIALQAENARRFLAEKTHYQEAAGHALQKIRKAAQLLRKLRREKAALKKTLLQSSQTPSLEEILFELTGLQTKQTLQGKILTLHTGDKLLLEKNNTFQIVAPHHSPKSSPKKNGPIEAIAYTTGWSETDALEWLARTFGPLRASRLLPPVLPPETPQYRTLFLESLERHDENQWATLSKTLVEKFRFNPTLLSNLKENRWIGANKFGHLTFGKIRFGANQKPIPVGKFIQDLQTPNGFRHETGSDGVTFLSHPDSAIALVSTNPLEALALKHLYPEKSVILVGEKPDSETQKILTQRKETCQIEIAEVLQPPNRLKSWLEAQILEGAKMLPLPLGVQSFLEEHLQPQKSLAQEIPTFSLLLDEPAPSQDVDTQKT